MQIPNQLISGPANGPLPANAANNTRHHPAMLHSGSNLKLPMITSNQESGFAGTVSGTQLQGTHLRTESRGMGKRRDTGLKHQTVHTHPDSRMGSSSSKLRL